MRITKFAGLLLIFLATTLSMPAFSEFETLNVRVTNQTGFEISAISTKWAHKTSVGSSAFQNCWRWAHGILSHGQSHEEQCGVAGLPGWDTRRFKVSYYCPDGKNYTHWFPAMDASFLFYDPVGRGGNQAPMTVAGVYDLVLTPYTFADGRPASCTQAYEQERAPEGAQGSGNQKGQAREGAKRPGNQKGQWYKKADPVMTKQKVPESSRQVIKNSKMQKGQ